ncbi:MAG: 2-octaprenyl-6-methoxyphenol hydroxylase [uncultured bacterium]|nr:MAG: 2-octaprenyl-6-methoxyphenol hydroxylase [uncultured bacterium]
MKNEKNTIKDNLLEGDVLIVGGGIVGLTLALALAKSSLLRIIVLEASEANVRKQAGRVSAITLASKQIFENLGVWSLIHNHASPFTRIAVWDDEDHALTFDGEELAAAGLGYIVANDVIQAALQQRLLEESTVNLHHDIALTDVVTYADRITLKTTTQTFQAALAVAAEGAKSWLREKAHIHFAKEDYHQAAIVATVTLSSNHQQIAKQHFLPTGPLAFLPLQNPHQVSIVWTLPSKEAEKKLALSSEDFCEQLNQVAKKHLGCVQAVEERALFPLAQQYAASYIAERIALVGDAVHVVHPLAGQGVNIGLLDAASLAQTITEAVRDGRDFASRAVLRRYERWRKADNVEWLRGIDIIKAIFATRSRTLRYARSFGLTILKQLPFLKNSLTRYAIGKRANLPDLACCREKGALY